MKVEKTVHEWSKEALFAKAQRYVERMLEKDPLDWEFSFWSALILEMLIRASLAKISPTLVANGSDWNNLYYAIGLTPNQKKFVPKSANISELVKRVESVYPHFTLESLDFCLKHIDRRNRELHSGSLAFDELRPSQWLAKFYLVCDVLLNEIDEKLETLFGSEHAKEAKKHIATLEKDNVKSVRKIIAAHELIWKSKPVDEQSNLSKQAETLATRFGGHRVNCPACKSVALLQGQASGAPRKVIDDVGVIEKQAMLPASFQCTACGLKISGYSKLAACDLGDIYTSTSHYSAVEYFDINIEEEFKEMFYEDNNDF